MIRFEPLQAHHLDTLVLREEDARDVALQGPQFDLKAAALARPGGAAVDEAGRVVAVFGFVETPERVSPWLLCSDLIDDHKMAVWRHARRFVKELQHGADRGRVISNWIPKCATRARAFVLALGFLIVPAPSGDFDYFYLPDSHVLSRPRHPGDHRRV